MARRLAWLAMWALAPPTALAQTALPDDDKARAEAMRRAQEAEAAKSQGSEADDDRRGAYRCADARARQAAALKANGIAPKSGTRKQDGMPCATCKPPECE